MNYQTHNDGGPIDYMGTCLQGYVDTTYGALVAAFGKPTTGDEYKVDWEWVIEFDDGTVATIYNWKDGPNYCGSEGLKASQITDWHIGGKGGRTRAMTLVGEVLAGQTQSNEDRCEEWTKKYSQLGSEQ
jgi:hypothetical protein